jgi:hypothetical protein
MADGDHTDDLAVFQQPETLYQLPWVKCDEAVWREVYRRTSANTMMVQPSHIRFSIHLIPRSSEPTKTASAAR